jgi:hypothetical protein
MLMVCRLLISNSWGWASIAEETIVVCVNVTWFESLLRSVVNIRDRGIVFQVLLLVSSSAISHDSGFDHMSLSPAVRGWRYLFETSMSGV